MKTPVSDIRHMYRLAYVLTKPGKFSFRAMTYFIHDDLTVSLTINIYDK